MRFHQESYRDKTHRVHGRKPKGDMCLGSILSLRQPVALRKPAWAGLKPRRLLLHIATAYEMFELREAGTAVRPHLSTP